MGLEITWFCLLCVLWTGYFVLEGFDFGVGMLLPVVGRNQADRTTMLESIGPVWDGNEVWLVVAGGATFAAFPVWYATMFSGFYLAFLLILVLLIVRVVSFEWREKAESPRWKAAWAWVNTIASVGAPLLWGIALSSLLHGVPIGSDQNFAGDFGDLFSGYTVLAGIAVCLLFAAHGAVFLRLRMVGDLYARARRAAAVAHAGGGGRRRRVSRLDARGRKRQQRQGRLPGNPARRRRGGLRARGDLARAGRQGSLAFVATTTTIVAWS